MNFSLPVLGSRALPLMLPALADLRSPARRLAYRVLWPCLLACISPSISLAGFVDVTSITGIDYVQSVQSQVPLTEESPDPRPTRTIISNYASAAAVDVDGDGWPDLLAARYNLAPVLYVNQRDGTFREEAVARGLGAVNNVGAFGCGDLDNDGDQDIMIAPAKGYRFYLFINDGTGLFTDDAVNRGAAVPTTLHDHESYSVGLVDYDRDGYLDIYVSEWGVPSSTENGLHSVLLHNLGGAAGGSFENVTGASGLGQPPAGIPRHYGFSSAWADFDGDGWPDLALAADFQASQFFWNNGDGTFTEASRASGIDQTEFGMGVAVADYDNDGKVDVYVTSIYDSFFDSRTGTHVGNKLYRNAGNRRFVEVSAEVGVARTGWGWGAAFFEFDNDGDPDLVVANGMDAAELGPAGPYYDALTDQTALLQNNGAGKFSNIASLAGIADKGLGKAVVVWDYDNDGDEDLVITNTFDRPIVYRSDASANGRKWIRFRFQGTSSNRDGIGATVRVTDAGRTQTALYNPTNAYIGQREAVLHFGVGDAGATADRVEVTWPGGTVQELSNLATNQVHLLVEPEVAHSPPVIAVAPVGGVFAKDGSVVLTASATGNPAPVYTWHKDGVLIAGANGPTLEIERIHPFDAGSYTVTAINPLGAVSSVPVFVDVSIDVGRHSVARWWDEFLLDAIRKDTPNPPVHARNLFHLSSAIWDAFWAYEEEGWTNAVPVFHQENVNLAGWTGGRETAQREAISYAAYRVLSQRFARSPGHARSEFGFRWMMEKLGFDPDFTGTSGDSPAAVGNRIGFAVLAAALDDGANEGSNYADSTEYASVNDPLVVALPGTTMDDPNRWQPLALAHYVTQNGIVVGEAVQSFVGVNALKTAPFALARVLPMSIGHDPGPPPQLGTATEAEFIQQAVEVIELSSQLDSTDGATIDISPGARFKNPVGSNAGSGHPLNPATGQPYTANVVKRGDYARVLAEFWADGPASETPPGHWNVVHNDVTDHPHFERRYAGQGPVLSPLEWDVRAYLALNGALHDAACAAWGIKRIYDTARPISMIRHLGGLGQSSDPAGLAYHPRGLPLIPGLIEVVTAGTSAPGQRHAHLAASVGKIALHAWRGKPTDPRTQVGGVGWILAESWVPYQLDTFVSPAFPGYVSGHSTFSRAAAEALTLLTGSPFFPGGLWEYHLEANEFLGFEQGPTAELALQWATYYDAADQAGRSRLFGGIHIAADDFEGRILGSKVGLDAFLKAQAMRHGRVSPLGLKNISTRGRAGNGDDVMITGFVIEGETEQPVLVRSVGPQLRAFGVVNFDQDPSMEVREVGALTALLANDNWDASPRAGRIRLTAEALGAFALAEQGKDAAEVVDLAPGGYTVVNRSAHPDGRGIQLAEIYGEKLVNLSTRGSVGADEGVVIAGFVIDTREPALVLVRGIGPALAAFGVARTLADPVIAVYRQLPDGSSGQIARNDNWSEDDRASLIMHAGGRSGAFALSWGSFDAGLLLQLGPGAYTVHISSADGTAGIALAEVYHVK